MKAVALTEAGAPARLTELSKPEPAAGQIRVRLAAAGVNPVDGKAALGLLEELQYPFVPGTDGAGTVDALGEGVANFTQGDPVFGRLTVAMGRGTYAEYTLAPADGTVARIPAGLDFVTAAALPVAGVTAMGVLDDLNPSEGAALLVVGATGGVGSFLTQLAARRGVEVIATAAPEFAQRIRDLGAAHTVNHHSPEPLADQVRSIRPRGVDALADLVGDPTVLAPLLGLLPQGAPVISTAGTLDLDTLEKHGLTGGRYKRRPTGQMLEHLGEMVAAGEIRVPIERTLLLAEGPRALAESTSGHLHGKTVLLISDLHTITMNS